MYLHTYLPDFTTINDPTLATSKELDQAVRILLAVGAGREAQDTLGNTALHLAADNRHSKTVRVLLASEANIEAKDSSGKTALHLAAIRGHCADPL